LTAYAKGRYAGGLKSAGAAKAKAMAGSVCATGAGIVHYFKPIEEDDPGLAAVLRGIMWLLFVPLLLGIYGGWLFQAIELPMTGIGGRIITLVAPSEYFLVLAPTLLFYTGPISFLVIWCAGLVICTWLWLISQSGWKVRAISLLTLALLLMAPIAVTGMYEPAPLSTPGLRSGGEVAWLTRPRGSLGLAIRRARFELGTYQYDDEFKLHGWSDDGRLYYSSFGPFGRRTLWVYDPAAGERAWRTGSLPEGFQPATEVSQLNLRHPSSRLRPRQPVGRVETSWNPRAIEESVSADGAMRALVIDDASVLHYEVVVVRRIDP